MLARVRFGTAGQARTDWFGHQLVLQGMAGAVRSIWWPEMIELAFFRPKDGRRIGQLERWSGARTRL